MKNPVRVPVVFKTLNPITFDVSIFESEDHFQNFFLAKKSSKMGSICKIAFSD